MLISLLVLGFTSCHKDGEPIPKYDQSESLSFEDLNESMKNDSGDDKVGDKSGGEIVGGDDGEDDDDDDDVSDDDDDSGGKGKGVVLDDGGDGLSGAVPKVD